MSLLGWLTGCASRRNDPWNLEEPLLHLSKHDAWRIKDSFEGVQVFGSTGSGKSSGSGAALAKAMLRAGYGGIVLTGKSGERALWERYCRETQREQSLILFSPSHTENRFNFLDYEFRRPGAGGGLTQNLVGLFSAVMEVSDRNSGSGGAQDYWKRSQRQLLTNAIDLSAIGLGRVSLPEINDIILSAPMSAQEVHSDTWQSESACMAAIRAGEERSKSAVQAHDFDLSAKYFLREFPNLSEKTRSIIVSCFTSLADSMMRGPMYELFCTSTTVVPEMTHSGAVIVLDTPVKEFGPVGQAGQVIWKYIWQQATERRDIERYPRPVFVWGDESQLFITSHDAVFQTTARSARACTVYLTQNLPNYFAALGGERSRAEVNSLLGNLQTKILHANGDAVTNNWAADLIAKAYSYRTTSGISTRDSDEGRGGVSHNTGGHEHLENQILPIEFTRLRKGGTESNCEVDGIIFQGGREWRASGKNFLRVTFKQG